MGVLLDTEARTEALLSQLRKVGSAILTQRSQCSDRMPMKQLSRSVVYADTNPKEERIAMLSHRYTNRYQHRSQELQSTCLAEYAATTDYQHSDDGECDALPPSNSNNTSTLIQLTDGFGKKKKCK